jgi:hypothetical protein
MKLRPFLESLMIQQKDARIVPFRLNWAQLELLEVVERQMATTGRVRIIVLKARQLGISTFFQALLFVLSFLTHGYRGLVVAHEIPASQNLLAMTHRYWDTYPFRQLYTLKSMSKNDLSWVETGSAIKIATAGNKALGRSSTIHYLHASEVAFWPDAEIAMLGLRQTVPNETGTVIALESTAEGVGNFFHRQWKLAEDGDSEYEPIFLPWWRHPEYLASHINVPHDNLGALDSEEKILRGMGLSDDRLAWRRWAIRNLCGNDLRKFQQEYPATPEEAFLSSGSNVFPAHSLRDCYKPERGYQGMLVRDGLSVKFVPHEDGPLTVFQAPSKDRDYGKYVVAGDPTHTTRGDYAVAQVLNRRTMEQVAVWRGRIDPASFGEELFKLGLYYHEALLVSEIEGPGYSTIGKLLGMEYPNIYRRARPDSTPGKVSGDLHGWSTTVQSKHLAVGWLLKCVVDGSLTLHHSKTYSEMQNYVTAENGGYENADNEAHDDTVMALAIAVTCHILDGPIMAYGSNPYPTPAGSLDPDLWSDPDSYDPEWRP